MFVREDQQWYFGEGILGKERAKLLRNLSEAGLVGRIDDEDEAVGVVVVVLPVGPDFALTTNVPDVKFESILGLLIVTRGKDLRGT